MPFKRPRVREQVLAHPDYYELRARLIRFRESGATECSRELDVTHPGPVEVELVPS